MLNDFKQYHRILVNAIDAICMHGLAKDEVWEEDPAEVAPYH